MSERIQSILETVVVVAIWIIFAGGVLWLMRRRGSAPLKFWQFTIWQFAILFATAAICVWLLRGWYLQQFGPFHH